MEILPQAFESATKHKDFNPDKIDQLFDLLRKLGTSFRDEMLKMKESGEGSLRTSQAAESVFGRKYSPQGKKYSIRYKEKDFNMRQHLKIDSKRRKNIVERKHQTTLAYAFISLGMTKVRKS